MDTILTRKMNVAAMVLCLSAGTLTGAYGATAKKDKTWGRPQPACAKGQDVMIDRPSCIFTCMNKMLLWIGMGCAMYVPLHATSGGQHNKKALAVAGYVRKGCPAYVPLCITDLIYQYWATGKRTKIGDVLALHNFQDFCGMRCWAFAPPSLFVTVGVHMKNLRNVFMLWDVTKDDLVFTKDCAYDSTPYAMMYMPRDKEDCLVVCYASQPFACFGLESRKEVFFATKGTCVTAHLARSLDNKGFVSFGGQSIIEEVMYWDMDTLALRTNFVLPAVKYDKELNTNSLVSFIDTEQFAILASYYHIGKQCQKLYVYHRGRPRIVRQVVIDIACSFNRYDFDTRFCMGKWIVMSTAQGFWVYDMCSQQQYTSSYDYDYGSVHSMHPLDETQFVLVTKHAFHRNTIAMKATLCDLGERNGSVCITACDSRVMDKCSSTHQAGYAAIAVLGCHYLLKNYWHGGAALHPLTSTT